MKRYHLAFLASAAGCLAVSFVLTGCGGKPKVTEGEDDAVVVAKSKDKGGKEGGKGGGGTSSGKQKQAIKVTEAGVIKGKITLEGDKPDLAALTNALQAQMKQDREYCLSGSEAEKSEQEYRIGANNGVGNVFVWIEPEAGYFFDVPEDQIKALPKEVDIDQPHCAFVPHCLVMCPRVFDSSGKTKSTGQKLVVHNSAKVAHNTKLAGAAPNTEKNETLPPGDKKTFELYPSNTPVTVECKIHPWMTGYIRIYNHPYATLSVVGKEAGDSAYGTYEIKGVPVGAIVRVYAWHEKAGFLGESKGQSIKLEKETTKDFSMKAK